MVEEFMDGFENRRKFAVMERAMRGQNRKFGGWAS